MGFRFRRSIKIAPGIRLNLNAKSTSVRIGPKGLGYTFSSNGPKRVSASIPGTGLSYSEVITPSVRRTPVVHPPDPSGPAPAKGRNVWPWILGVVGIIVAFNLFGNDGSSTNRSSASLQPRSANSAAPAIPEKPAPAISTPTVNVSAPAAPPPATAPETRFVTASSLNVRSAPNTSGEIVGKASSGQQLTILERASGWLLVQTSAGGRGWVSEQYTSTTRPTPVAAPAPQALVSATPPSINRDAIIQKIIERSIRNYSGSCPCPYNTMRNGRRCGGNSAYSKPGGRSPICFPSDVTEAMIAAFR